MRLKLLFNFSFVFLLLFFNALHANGETLHEALARAYGHNPLLNRARASNDAAAQGVWQARANYRPRITAQGNYSFDDIKNKNTANSFSQFSTQPYGFNVELSQNLFSGFSRSHQLRSARHLLSASSSNLVSVEQDTLLACVSAYLDVLQGLDLVNIRRENLEFLQTQTRAAEARLQVGQATITDVSQSQAQLALAQAQLSMAISSLAFSQAQYRLVIGNDPENLIWPSLLSDVEYIALPSSLQQALEVSLASHPSLATALDRLASAESDESALKSLFLPSVNLRLSSGKTYPDRAQTPRSTENHSLLLSMQVPLYRGGSEYAALRLQKATISQRKYDVEHIRLQLHSLVVSTWSRLEVANSNYQANLKQLKAAKLALEGVVKERDVGSRTQLDVLDGQNAVLRAEEFLLNSRAGRIIAEYELLSAMGDLTAQNLALNVDIITPAKEKKFLKLFTEKD